MMGYQGEFEKISVIRWRNSSSPPIYYALPNSWFGDIKLVNPETFKVGILHYYYEI
jgi:RNA-directed DNA polymerase